MTDTTVDTLKVLFLSNWFSNPYKTLLIKNLSSQNVQIEEHRLNRFFLFKALKMRDLDVIHFHALPIPLVWGNYFFHLLKFALFALQATLLRFLGVKIIWTIHEWDSKLSSRKVNYNPIYAKLFSNCFDVFISHCESSEQSLVRELGDKSKDKSSVIYHGNFIDWYENKSTPLESRRALDISDESLTFLLFGSIYPYKGVLEAIEAFQNLQHPNATLLIVGQANSQALEANIREKAQASDKIKFISERVADKDVQVYMNASDCVLVPYKVFTTSGVAILAMSFGKACIAPKMGFFDDVLDDSGTFFYDPDSQSGLQQAMQAATVDKSLLSDMGNYNLGLAKQWSWSYVAEKTLDVYAA